MQRKKPSKLLWTQSWRRLNKKLKDENLSKKKSRKVVKIQRAIVGASLDEVGNTMPVNYFASKLIRFASFLLQIKTKVVAKKPASAATEAALKEVKERSKAVAAKKRVVAKAGGGKGIIPKHQNPGFNARGGAKL